MSRILEFVTANGPLQIEAADILGVMPWKVRGPDGQAIVCSRVIALTPPVQGLPAEIHAMLAGGGGRPASRIVLASGPLPPVRER